MTFNFHIVEDKLSVKRNKFFFEKELFPCPFIQETTKCYFMSNTAGADNFTLLKILDFAIYKNNLAPEKFMVAL